MSSLKTNATPALPSNYQQATLTLSPLMGEGAESLLYYITFLLKRSHQGKLLSSNVNNSKFTALLYGDEVDLLILEQHLKTGFPELGVKLTLASAQACDD